ncbi:MAG: hypothetical protein J6O49_05420 [Bacteroidaceae bacterium]|nr:hypothetical protein [Bacteroidaceae bacterium]
MGGAFLLVFSVLLTSCDDILGEWNPPAPATVVPADVQKQATILGAALENGSKFKINYTINGHDCWAVFEKTGDNTYALIEAESQFPPTLTSGTRATTRVVSYTYTATLTYADGKLVFKLTRSDDTLFLQVTFNPADDTCEFIATAFSGAAFSNLTIGDETAAAAITTETKKMIIAPTTAPDATYIYFYYKPGETWEEMDARYKAVFGDNNQISIFYRDNTIYYDQDKHFPISSSDVIGKKGDADVDRYYIALTMGEG